MVGRCDYHEIVFLGAECPKCKRGVAPKLKRRGTKDRGKTPLLKLGGVRKERVYGKASGN